MQKHTNANMLYTEPKKIRTPRYNEHYCFIFKDGSYVGSLYLTDKMRDVWRHNKYSVVMTDV